MPASRKLGRERALEIARSVRKVTVSKGKKLTVFKMADKPSDDELLEQMLGPTGNLRAPLMVRGEEAFVGFPLGGFWD